MVDSYVLFSNPKNLDSFPSFKSFHEQKNDQGAFTIDERDIAEMQINLPTNQSKQNDPKPVATKKSNSNTSLQCDICSVPLSSQVVYDVHITGRKHQAILTALLTKNPQYKPLTYEELCSKNQEPVVMNNQNQLSEPSSVNLPVIPSKQLVCNTCNISCNSQQMFDKHIIGKKHQMKLKSAGSTNPVPVRNIPDNNPSSSNYCDVCSLQLKSENELTEHLAQKRHQTKAKEAETCAKAATEMKINFDDYKIVNTTTEKNAFNYECTRCNKKMSDKMQLIYHLKSASHTRIANQVNKELPPRNSKQGKYPITRGGTMRSGLAARSRGQSSSRGLNKPLVEKSHPYQTQRPSWKQSFHGQTPENPFGAFDPYNEAIYPYPTTKRPVEYENIPSEYDGFYPKRSCTYNDRPQNSEEYYSTSGNYPSWNTDSYSSQTSNYPDPSGLSKTSWTYPTEPYYDQQQYANSEPDYTNSIYYPPSQPPLPNYEPPPLPNYPPPPPSEPYYAQNSTYPVSTENQTSSQYYPTSFQY